ncbi:hypothetical protein Tco_0973847 [Tanacetum coccineum]|uniref:Uncharacterized protein n=1 Tax=Tanacetum coccineum TaxID=301880 RepID=A0ABQ5E9Z2_9ASTR
MASDVHSSPTHICLHYFEPGENLLGADEELSRWSYGVKDVWALDQTEVVEGMVAMIVSRIDCVHYRSLHDCWFRRPWFPRRLWAHSLGVTFSSSLWNKQHFRTILDVGLPYRLTGVTDEYIDCTGFHHTGGQVVSRQLGKDYRALQVEIRIMEMIAWALGRLPSEIRSLDYFDVHNGVLDNPRILFKRTIRRSGSLMDLLARVLMKVKQLLETYSAEEPNFGGVKGLGDIRIDQIFMNNGKRCEVCMKRLKVSGVCCGNWSHDRLLSQNLEGLDKIPSRTGLGLVTALCLITITRWILVVRRLYRNYCPVICRHLLAYFAVVGLRNGDHDSPISGNGARRISNVLLEKCKLTKTYEDANLSSQLLCVEKSGIKFSTCTLLAGALTWWNSHVRIVGHDVGCFHEESEKVWNGYVGGLPDLIQDVLWSNPKPLQEATEIGHTDSWHGLRKI